MALFDKIESLEEGTMMKSACMSAINAWLLKIVIPNNSRSAVKSVDLLKELHMQGSFGKDEVLHLMITVISSVRCLRDPSDILKNMLHILEVFSSAFAIKKMSKSSRQTIIEYASILCYMLEGEELSDESQRDVSLILEVLRVKESEIVKPVN